MTSLFPALFTFSLPAIFILRVTAGIFFLMFGMRVLQATYAVKERGRLIRIIGYGYGLLKFVTGMLLIMGIFTQLAVISGMILSALTFIQEKSTQTSSTKQVQILLFIICLSLLFLGPGLYAYDMPL